MIASDSKFESLCVTGYTPLSRNPEVVSAVKTIADLIASMTICLMGCDAMTSIDLPDSLTSIGDYAFQYCAELTSVNLPASVTEIGVCAFDSCYANTAYAVDADSQTYSAADGILYSKDMTELILAPAGKHWAFDIPDTVTAIGDYACNGCRYMTSVTIPYGVTEIGTYGLSFCKSLQEIVVPDSVTSVGEYAFDSCYGLEHLTIPWSVTAISNGMLNSCTGLETVTYTGTQAWWDAVTVGTYNDPLAAATIIFAPAEPRIASAAVTLGSSINMEYDTVVPGFYTDAHMVINGDSYLSDDGTYLYEIYPHEIGDSVSATLYATGAGIDGQDSVTYSPLQYCVDKLIDETISSELRTLISDLLAYGSALQIYNDYNTDKLVTSGIDSSLLTCSTFQPLSEYAVRFNGIADNDICWASAGLTMTNSIAMNFRFYAESIENLTVNVAINGREQTFTSDDFAAVDGKANMYEISFTGISAEEFADAVTASFYQGGTQIGNSVSYSVNSYVQSKQNSENTALQALVKALYNYGAAAKAYEESLEVVQ